MAGSPGGIIATPRFKIINTLKYFPNKWVGSNFLHTPFVTHLLPPIKPIMRSWIASGVSAAHVGNCSYASNHVTQKVNIILEGNKFIFYNTFLNRASGNSTWLLIVGGLYISKFSPILCMTRNEQFLAQSLHICHNTTTTNMNMTPTNNTPQSCSFSFTSRVVQLTNSSRIQELRRVNRYDQIFEELLPLVNLK